MQNSDEILVNLQCLQFTLQIQHEKPVAFSQEAIDIQTKGLDSSLSYPCNRMMTYFILLVGLNQSSLSHPCNQAMTY